ncbi:MAG: right-handed parallel beta-helix repeat-containing protein [Nanoarchaeota archaeon]|nr:right-handed parallel beta-helix repeat-containing protein [Nanoarchaeota archaeon]
MRIFLILFFLFALIGISYGIDISSCNNFTSSGYYNLTADILSSNTNYCLNISSNNVVLDCQGHLVQGNGSGADYGIYAGRSTAQNANITIRNCNIENWQYFPNWFDKTNNLNLDNFNVTNNSGYGMYFVNTNNISFSNSKISKNLWGGFNMNSINNFTGSNLIIFNNSQNGIYLGYISNSNLNNLTVVNNDYNGVGIIGSMTNVNFSNFNISNNGAYGIYFTFLTSTSSLILRDGFIQENLYWDVDFSTGSFNINDCNKINFSNIVGSGGRPIEFYHTNSVTLENNIYSQLIMCSVYNPSGFTLRNITIDGSDTLNNNGLLLVGGNASNNIIDNITSIRNYVGVKLFKQDYAIIFNSTFINNTFGFQITSSGKENKIYDNFFNNSQNILISTSNVNFFNNSLGGNYYHRLDGRGYSDLCSDLNSNGFCDYPFMIYSNLSVDYLPRTLKLGNMIDYLVFSCQKLSEPGDYILQNNVINSSETICIEVLYDNISLDCQRYNLGGQDLGGSYGIYFKKNNISLKNCDVHNWFAGIYIVDTIDSVIDNFVLYNNDYPLVATLNNALINNSIFFNNSNKIWIFGMENSSISNNNIYDNVNSGSSIIDVGNFDNSSFFNNNIYNNAWNGVFIQGSDSKIYSNNIYNNVKNGLTLNMVNNYQIYDNQIYNNELNGFALLSSQDNLIYNNTFSNNNVNIYLSSVGNNSWNNSFTGNTYLSSNLTGFSQTCNDTAPVDGFCDLSYTLAVDNIDYLPIYSPYIESSSNLWSIFPFASILIQLLGVVLVLLYLVFV